MARIAAGAGPPHTAAGDLGEIVTAELIRDVYGIGCLIEADPVTGRPMMIPADGG